MKSQHKSSNATSIPTGSSRVEISLLKFFKVKFQQLRMTNVLKQLPFLILILTSTLLIFWRINDRYVAFTDELLFEEASYRMAFPEMNNFNNQDDPTRPPLQKGRSYSWLIPTNNNQVWLEKPPLYFWLTAPIFWLFNQLKSINPLTDSVMHDGEFIYPWIRRFWTAIAGVAIVTFTYGIAKQMINKSIDQQIKKLKNIKTINYNLITTNYAKRITNYQLLVPILSSYLLLASPLFLATTKSASLDLTATAFMTGAIYFYMKSLNHKSIKPHNHTINPFSSALYLFKSVDYKLPITYYLLPITIALAIMTRSFLALTPIGLIIIDQILYKKHRWKFKQWFTFVGIILIIILPWHLTIYSLYPQDFLQTYLGFNLIHHAVRLTPGYQQTSPFYYFIELIRNIPWLLPFLTASLLFLLYFKRTLNHQNNKSEFPITNFPITFLLLWIALPFTILTFSSTRHSWYLVQITPPLSIIIAYLLHQTYQAIASCSKCATLKYFAQISFLTFTLASIIAVLTASDPSTAPVKALRWARANLSPQQPLYAYQQNFLPHTLLFRPHPTQIITDLSQLSPNSYIFIADFLQNLALRQNLQIVSVKRYKPGSIYHFPAQKFLQI